MTDVGLPEDDCAAGLPWLEVPIRFHLLRSEVSNLNATFSEGQISSLVADAQQLWNQACIRLVIETVIENPLTVMQELDYNRRKDEVDAAEFRQLMLNAMPRSNLLRPGWNVMIFRAFERFSSGVYFSEIPSVLLRSVCQRLQVMPPIRRSFSRTRLDMHCRYDIMTGLMSNKI